MKPISINLVFENCDTVTIPMEYTSHFNLSGITTTLAFNSRTKETYEVQNANSGYILFSSAFSMTTLETHFEDNAYERIKKYNDICYITINYEDNTSKEYGILWPNETETHCNPNQKSSEEYGALMLEINP